MTNHVNELMKEAGATYKEQNNNKRKDILKQ